MRYDRERGESVSLFIFLLVIFLLIHFFPAAE